jgi:hypothetical protein
LVRASCPTGAVAAERPRSLDAAYLQFLAQRHEALNSRSDLATTRVWGHLFAAVDDLIQRAAKHIAASSGADSGKVAAALEFIRDKVAEALKPIRQQLKLPPVTADRNRGGRPPSFFSDAVAFAASEHFRQQTGSPQWREVCRWFNASHPRGAMTPNHVRQRVVRWRRSREKLLFELVADSFQAEYGRNRRAST